MKSMYRFRYTGFTAESREGRDLDLLNELVIPVGNDGQTDLASTHQLAKSMLDVTDRFFKELKPFVHGPGAINHKAQIHAHSQ